MSIQTPTAQLAAQFSSPEARPVEWEEAGRRLEQAAIYWLSTVRPDGRPHVTPLIGLWLDGAFYFCTGGDERKARNLSSNSHVAVTTGCNSIHEGLDLVVEGEAVPVRDESQLEGIAAAYASKYGEGWRFEVRDGAFLNQEGGEALVFRVAPTTAFGFGKGETFSQTRWRF